MSEKPKKKRGGRKAGSIIHYVDPVLKIMRKCVKTKRTAGETTLMKMYRDMQELNPEKFLQQLAKMEADHTKAVNEYKSKIGRMGDDGSEKAIALVEELLAKLKKK